MFFWDLALGSLVVRLNDSEQPTAFIYTLKIEIAGSFETFVPLQKMSHPRRRRPSGFVFCFLRRKLNLAWPCGTICYHWPQNVYSISGAGFAVSCKVLGKT